MKLLIVCCLIGSLSGCALSRPCSSGGDLTWANEFKGDKKCQKKKMKTGEELNHGRYTAYYSNGRPGLIGSFYEGKKHGIWSQYNEKGEKTLEKYYDHGVEKMSPLGIEPVPAAPIDGK
ncbi:MAG: hypothetical protein KA715_06695 [Xanthomonadaceae bacterium]|nr:hypothetical protein [Xanthomonadaceae bacterium]